MLLTRLRLDEQGQVASATLYAQDTSVHPSHGGWSNGRTVEHGDFRGAYRRKGKSAEVSWPLQKAHCVSAPNSEGGQPHGLAPLFGSEVNSRVDGHVYSLGSETGQVYSGRRVRVYIDGFNLYHAICTLNNPKLKWLNFWKLSETFLRQGEVLDEVHMFTAVLTWNREKQQRHVNFLEACRAVGVQVHEANFKKSYKTCATFGRECKFFEEKQTDVAIAIKMVSDALLGQLHRAILITADSDQIPTAKFLRTLPNIELSIVFPPGRKSMARELAAIAHGQTELASGRLLTCMLPRSVVDPSGKHVASMPALYLEPPISC